MKHVARLLFAVSLFPAVACDDPAPRPGAITANWTLGPVATCGSLGLTKIEARAYKGTVLENTATADCPAAASSGTLTVEELMPAKYRLVVEGLTAADKATWKIEAPSVTVGDGKTVETAELRLEEKPAAVVVDWNLPGGGRCATSSVDRVLITLFNSQGKELSGQTQTVDCDATFKDPDSAELTAGAYFPGLEPLDGLVVLAYGLDSTGAKIARGQVSGTNLGAGDTVPVVVTLETCATAGCN